MAARSTLGEVRTYNYIPRTFSSHRAKTIPRMDSLCYELLEQIFELVNPGDLHCIAQTCSTLNERVDSYLKERFALEPVLSLFFTPEDVADFYGMLHETGAVIIGTTAFHFFDRSMSKHIPLELLVDSGDRSLFHEWLKSSGYDPIFIEEDWPIVEEDNDVWSDVTIADFVNGDDMFVRVHSTDVEAREFVLGLHITSAMNFISTRGAHSLYPRATFDIREGLPTHNLTIGTSLASTEYFAQLGFTIVDHEQLARGMQTNFYPEQQRYVGDSKTWSFIPSNKGKYRQHLWKLVYRHDKAYTSFNGAGGYESPQIEDYINIDEDIVDAENEGTDDDSN
ncbi:hypothetical protein BDN72DRAFT_904316 [Pluteus cervinus]|uniref:Uncharacterized protein n=1 Tax=Pluteus cervinus TaxID=181527 RepID=A0ACD3A6M3_9AGAR|nr:hypothetical protein BDN72DRAFT_904316 [Pluteus cervinus]